MSASNERLKLFSVPSRKMILMSCSTCTMYCFYWIYKNWQSILKFKNTQSTPLNRTLLYPFYNFTLFNEIKSIANKNNINVWWTSPLIAISFLIILIGFFFPYTWMISIFAGVIFLPVNNVCTRINEVNGFGERSQEGFHKIDWIILFLGGINVVAAVIKTIRLSGVLPALI